MDGQKKMDGQDRKNRQDGLMDKNRWLVGWIEKQIYEKIDGWMDGKYRWMVGCIKNWMDGWKEGYKIDGWLDGFKLLYEIIYGYKNI